MTVSGVAVAAFCGLLTRNRWPSLVTVYMLLSADYLSRKKRPWQPDRGTRGQVDRHRRHRPSRDRDRTTLCHRPASADSVLHSAKSDAFRRREEMAERRRWAGRSRRSYTRSIDRPGRTFLDLSRNSVCATGNGLRSPKSGRAQMSDVAGNVPRNVYNTKRPSTDQSVGASTHCRAPQGREGVPSASRRVSFGPSRWPESEY